MQIKENICIHNCVFVKQHTGIQNDTCVFPENVIGSLFGPIANENTHNAYADLSSYAINRLLRPAK
jgi:acyl-[acyl carrier protein]--UDP-N-acetylglucosamine O-acyltransferase